MDASASGGDSVTTFSLRELGRALIDAAVDQQIINLGNPAKTAEHAGIPSRDPREGRAKVSWRAQREWEERIDNPVWVGRYGQKI